MKRKPKRRPDGRWQRKKCGKLFISSISQADADRQANEYAQLIKNGLRRDADSTTVRELITKQLPDDKCDVQEHTYTIYARIVTILCEYVGDYIIRDVKPADINHVFADFFVDKSHAYIVSAFSIYKRFFEYAVDNGYSSKNPCKAESIKLPKGTEGSHRSLEKQERELIETKCYKHPLYPLLMTILYTGMRPSEAMAINIDRDIDFQKSTITIREARHIARNKATVTSQGKTPNAIGRVIPLFTPLYMVLYGRHGLIVDYDGGKVLSHSSFQGKWKSYINQMEAQMNGHKKLHHHRMKNDPIADEVKKLIKEGKTEEAEELRLADWKYFTVRPYDLRHEFCSWCCDNEVDMHTLIEWMGHKDSEMIRKIYDHVRSDRILKEAQKLENSWKSSLKSSHVK